MWVVVQLSAAGFEVHGSLGSGAMGSVYLARARGHAHLAEGVEVALKIANRQLSPSKLRRARREADAGTRVRSPWVVRTLDHGTFVYNGAQVPYVAVERVRGITLRELRDRLGRVPESLCRHIGLRVARGLVAIHKAGLVHRDIKPDNVMITDAHEVKILDLGVAWMRDATSTLTETGGFVGTLRYAAPEQLRGVRRADERSDLYSLGATLYELMTGSTFRADAMARRWVEHGEVGTPDATTIHGTTAVEESSSFFLAFTNALLADDPGDRFESAAAVVQALLLGEESAWYRVLHGIRLSATARAVSVCLTKPTSFRGRADELTKLERTLDDARAGSGSCAVIGGPGGCGKSRLIDELLRRTPDTERTVILARNVPGGSGDGLVPLIEGIAAMFAPAEVEGAFVRLLGGARGLASGLACILDGRRTADAGLSLDADRINTACVRILKALSRERTLVLIVEDLHLLASSGEALFAALARGIVGERLLLLGTTRRPGDAWLHALNGAEHIELPPLATDDLGAMARALARDEELEASSVERMTRLASGNPLFLIELVRAGCHMEEDEEALPASLSSSVNARLSGLASSDRELLEVASCIGFEFDPSLLARVVAIATGSDRDLFVQTVQDLARIRREHGLIRPTGSTFSFEHHVVHACVLREIFPGLRRRVHRLIADAMEDDDEVRSGERDHRIVLHRLEADEFEKAIDYVDGAVAHLTGRCAHQDVYALLDRVLAHPEAARHPRWAALEMSLLDASKALGRLARDGARLQAAISEFRERRNDEYELRAMMHAGQSAIWREDFDSADAIFAEVRRRGDMLGDEAAVVGAAMQLGRTAMYRLEHDVARRHLERVLASPRSKADPMTRARALGNLALVPDTKGGDPTPEAMLRECAQTARASGFPDVLGTALGNLGFLLHRKGRVEECILLTKEMITVARDSGDRMRETFGLGNLGVFQREMGRYTESDDCFVQSAQISRELGDQHGLAMAAMNQAIGDIQTGWLDRAGERLREAQRITAEGGDRTILSALRRADASLWAARSEHERAIACLDKSLEVARDDYDRGMAHLIRGLILLDREASGAGASLAQASALGRSADAPVPTLGGIVGLAVIGKRPLPDAMRAYDSLHGRIPLFELADLARRLWRTSGSNRCREDGAAAVRAILADLPPEGAALALEANESWAELLSGETG